MEYVKIFYSSDKAESLENKINEWLKNQGDTIEIVRRMQNTSGQVYLRVIITIFYKKSRK
jgi:hypothetical protein